MILKLIISTVKKFMILVAFITAVAAYAFNYMGVSIPTDPALKSFQQALGEFTSPHYGGAYQVQFQGARRDFKFVFQDLATEVIEDAVLQFSDGSMQEVKVQRVWDAEAAMNEIENALNGRDGVAAKNLKEVIQVGIQNAHLAFVGGYAEGRAGRAGVIGVFDQRTLEFVFLTQP